MATIDFFAGEIISELLNQLLLLSAKQLRYNKTVGNLISLIKYIEPTIKEIQYSGVELPAHRQVQIGIITDTLKEGKVLTEKFLSSKRWNMFRQISLARKIDKLERKISDFLKSPILTYILADVHLLRANSDVRYDRVIGGGGLIMDAMKRAEAAMEIESKEDLENLGVGLELGKRKLKKMMFDAEGGLFGISGMGGVGKTTLARELVRDDEVRCHFDNRILFLTVSRSPILEELRAHVWAFLSDYKAVNPIPNRNFQFKGRIKMRKLLILDDVWTREVLDCLTYYLPGCTTLVVSRSKLTDPEATYDVEVLREDEAISLLCLCAFGQKSVPPGFSKNLVKQVADECKGFPLALKVVGTSLKDRPEKYWEGVLQRLSKGVLVDETRLLHQMESSLENLDPITRECFLDLAAFPEDRKIPIGVLINMWIEVHDLEEGNAFAILVNLSEHNLLTLEKNPRLGSSYSSYHDIFVTQHNLLRDLALHICNQGEVNRRQRLLMPKRELVLPREWERNSDEPYNAEIVSIHTGEMNETEWFDMVLPKAEVLILIFSSDKYVLPPFITKMIRLRVLVIINNGMSPAVLHGFSIIGNLSKLRSLWLERVQVPELSNTTIPLKKLHKMSLILCKINNSFEVDLADIFPNLGYLTIDHCDDLVALPTSICGMTSLNSLSITNCPHLRSLPKKLSKLQALESLRLYACPELNLLPFEICEFPRLKYFENSQCVNSDCLLEETANITTFEMGECSYSGRSSSAVTSESLRNGICEFPPLNYFNNSQSANLDCLLEEIRNLTTFEMGECCYSGRSSSAVSSESLRHGICEFPPLKYFNNSQSANLDCLLEEIGNLTKFEMGECCYSGRSSSAVSSESLRHGICDKDVALMWEEVEKAVSTHKKLSDLPIMLGSFPSSPPNQVFINFRGEQLRMGFVSHLFKALEKDGINVFIDENEIRGEDLTRLFTRIEESKIAIVVFSSMYTESRWCLNELEKIKECVDLGKLVAIPIFYKIETNDVKHMEGEFGDNFRSLTREYGKEDKWREAVAAVSKKFGIAVDNRRKESEFVDQIVEDVTRVLNTMSTDLQRREIPDPPLFGIEPRVKQQIEEILAYFLSEKSNPFVPSTMTSSSSSSVKLPPNSKGKQLQIDC